MFGYQIKYITDVFQAKFNPLDAGLTDEQLKFRLEMRKEYSKVIMQIILSIVILFSCLYILLKSEDENLRPIAVWFLGVIVGYWLR